MAAALWRWTLRLENLPRCCSGFFFFFQAEDGIRDGSRDWSSDVCSSDLRIHYAEFVSTYGLARAVCHGPRRFVLSCGRRNQSALPHACRSDRLSSCDFLPHGLDRPVRRSLLAVHLRAVDFLRARGGLGLRLAPQGTRFSASVSRVGISDCAGDFRSRGFRPHRESVHPAPRPIHDWSAPDSRGPPLLSALEASQLSCSLLGGKLSGAKERIVPLSRLQEERLREPAPSRAEPRSEEHTSELQSRLQLVCRLLLEKKKKH